MTTTTTPAAATPVASPSSSARPPRQRTRHIRGNRPGFSSAAAPAEGERLYTRFAAALSAQGIPVATGRFGADMKVSLVNDGPVTIWMDSDS